MRRILVDRARAKLSGKRGGRANRVEAPELAAPLADDRLIELDAALSQLAVARPDHAKLIELRYFAGLTANDAAAVLSVSLSTANRMCALCPRLAGSGNAEELSLEGWLKALRRPTVSRRVL